MSIVQHDITITVRDASGRVQASETSHMTIRKARNIARDIAEYLRRYAILSCGDQWLYRYEPREGDAIRVYTNPKQFNKD